MGRTSIVVDDALLEEAMRMTGAKTGGEAVEMALRRLVEKGSLYRTLRMLQGKLDWTGDIGSRRRSRPLRDRSCR